MSACRYEISLRVFNSIAHELAQRTSEHEHEKRNSISTSNHVLFFYHINAIIALYWEEKPTSLMNENK